MFESVKSPGLFWNISAKHRISDEIVGLAEKFYFALKLLLVYLLVDLLFYLFIYLLVYSLVCSCMFSKEIITTYGLHLFIFPQMLT